MYQKTLEGMVIEARVKTGCNSFSIRKVKEKFLIEVSAPPVEGKANKEIIKELKKLFKSDVEIVKGLKSKDKIILIRVNKEEIENIIRKI